MDPDENERIKKELVETKTQLQEANKKIDDQDREIEELRARSVSQSVADGSEKIAEDLEKLKNIHEKPDYSEWRKQRTNTIEKLDEFREKLDAVCVRANYGKAVGSGSEIAGAATAIVGDILASQGVESGQMIMSCGNLVQNAGTTTEGVSSAIEYLVTEKYLNEINTVLDKDKELSRPLDEWLKYTKELDTKVQEIFGVSLEHEKLKITIEAFYEYSKISSSVRSFEESINFMRQGKYSEYVGNIIEVGKFQILFRLLHAYPKLSHRIRENLRILSVSTFALQVAADGVRSYRSIMRICSSSVVETPQGGLSPSIPTAREVAFFCVLKAASLASSFILMKHAISIIKCGKSKYSEKLKLLTDDLKKELESMKG